MILEIVVPCYNEEEVLEHTFARLKQIRDDMVNGKLLDRVQITFIDDGSKDGTWGVIEKLVDGHDAVKGVKLSRNFGHQGALLAGLLSSSGDCVVSLDADLQDDVSVIAGMVQSHLDGNDVVYGVRRQRGSDSFLKRSTALFYYRLLAWLGVEVVHNHADFRLLSREVVERLADYREVNLFLRGLIPQLGFSSSTVEYDRAARFAGASKYPARKMLALAIDGVTSFSAVPLRLIALLGIVVFLFSILASAWIIYARFFADSAIPGWASTLLPMFFLGGVQLLSLGVIGEYVGKIYLETKGRPRYLIETIILGSDLAEPNEDQA